MGRLHSSFVLSSGLAQSSDSPGLPTTARASSSESAGRAYGSERMLVVRTGSGGGTIPTSPLSSPSPPSRLAWGRCCPMRVLNVEEARKFSTLCATPTIVQYAYKRIRRTCLLASTVARLGALRLPHQAIYVRHALRPIVVILDITLVRPEHKIRHVLAVLRPRWGAGHAMPVRIQVVCKRRPHPADKMRERHVRGAIAQGRDVLLRVAEDEGDLELGLAVPYGCSSGGGP